MISIGCHNATRQMPRANRSKSIMGIGATVPDAMGHIYIYKKKKKKKEHMFTPE